MTGETIVVALLMAGLGGGCLFLTLLTLPGNWAILILVGAAQLWSLSGDGAPLYSGTLAVIGFWTLAVFGGWGGFYSGLPLPSWLPLTCWLGSSSWVGGSMPSWLACPGCPGAGM